MCLGVSYASTSLIISPALWNVLLACWPESVRWDQITLVYVNGAAVLPCMQTPCWLVSWETPCNIWLLSPAIFIWRTGGPIAELAWWALHLIRLESLGFDLRYLLSFGSRGSIRSIKGPRSDFCLFIATIFLYLSDYGTVLSLLVCMGRSVRNSLLHWGKSRIASEQQSPCLRPKSNLS